MRFAAFIIAAALAVAGAASAGTGTPRYETLPEVPPLPALAQQGYVDHAGARIGYGIAGRGSNAALLRFLDRSGAHKAGDPDDREPVNPVREQ